MDDAVVMLRFPSGTLPSRGFRCSVCGKEALLPGDADETTRLAERLGLFGLQDVGRRKLQRTGNSITVSLSPSLVRDVLHAAPGDHVRVARQGGRIVIEADAEA